MTPAPAFPPEDRVLVRTITLLESIGLDPVLAVLRPPTLADLEPWEVAGLPLLPEGDTMPSSLGPLTRCGGEILCRGQVLR